MGVHIENNKLVTTTEPKTIHFNLSKNAVNNLKHEIDLFIKRKELLAEQKIGQLLSTYKYGNDIHEYGKSKLNETHKFIVKLL